MGFIERFRFTCCGNQPGHVCAALFVFFSAKCSPGCGDHARAALCVALWFQLSTALGVASAPELRHVASQLKAVVSAYTLSEKAAYLHLLTHIYEYLTKQTADDVTAAMTVAGLKEWVWHGDGFSEVGRVVLRPLLFDARPYVFCLAAEMQVFSALFASVGVQTNCSVDVLIQVSSDSPFHFARSCCESQ